MGLLAQIYRSGTYDCTNGGATAKAEVAVIVNVDGQVTPAPDRPALMIIEHPAGAHYGTIAVPAVLDEHGRWTPYKRAGMVGPMAGGNIVYSGDARFNRATAPAGMAVGSPVRVHDRFETPAH